MAWKFCCYECGRAFKSAKGKRWHEARTGHDVDHLNAESQDSLRGLTREEVIGFVFG